MRIRAVFLDLDDSLLQERGPLNAAYLATCRRVRERHGIDPDALHLAVRRHARDLWSRSPHGGYTNALGISSSEGLSGCFDGGGADDVGILTIWVAGEDPPLSALSPGRPDTWIRSIGALPDALARLDPEHRRVFTSTSHEGVR